MTDVGRVALATRVFTLAALISITVLNDDRAVDSLIVVGVVALAMCVLSLTRRLPEPVIVVIEGAVIAVIALVFAPHSDPVMPYLAIPVLLGGLSAGWPGLLRVLAAESITFALGWFVIDGSYDRQLVSSVFTWLVTGCALGVLGRAVRANLASPEASYRSALDLLKQLRALSGKLVGGLDPVSLAEGVMSAGADAVPAQQSAVFVRSDSGLISPLRYSDGASPERFHGIEEWLSEGWDQSTPLMRGNLAAVPLRAESQVIGRLVMLCAQPPPVEELTELGQRLTIQSLQLYAALVFDDVRNTATTEERHRIAREVHDGVAQDVASLGYIVDNLVAGALNEEQSSQLGLLREEVTRVVGELRHSVFDLRNEVGSGQGLGQSLSSFARHVGSHSDLTVHVRLDEAPTRLRPEVEAELLRIAQEAMNNARKHSGGENLWVSCTVLPPYAEIEVLDDGLGMQEARPDSHGVRIMRERAERIGADLDVQTPAVDDRGTRLRVRVGEPQKPRNHAEEGSSG